MIFVRHGFCVISSLKISILMTHERE